MPLIRLDRFFSSQEILSRKEVRVAVKRGTVSVNGEPACSSEQKIDPDIEVIAINGERVPYKPFLYLMLNKPRGIVSATKDPMSSTVLDLVPPALFRSDLFPAGRLDRDSEGFVLITNDGSFAHRILSPGSHVEKTYHVWLDGIPNCEGISRMESGISLSDGTQCLPAKVTVLDLEECLAEVVLREGKYHQIKRMFGVLSLGVNRLKRVKIGGLLLDETLPVSGCREIMHKELEQILAK